MDKKKMIDRNKIIKCINEQISIMEITNDLADRMYHNQN